MARKDKVQESTGPVTLPYPRAKKKQREEVIPKLVEQFKYTSVMQAPKLDKIVINMGTGSKTKNGDKHLENSVRDMALISGQKPVITRAKKAVSNFKVRENEEVGCKVTLRGDRMYHFFDKLTSVVLPRIRDFQGLSAKSFDGRGNYAMGLKEQLVFPEIPYDTFDRIRGMDIIICTTAKTDEESYAFLKAMGLPLREK
ncbi:50S ribosomal protein L5 [Fimbriimonas ginsengisoli]|uniref:Large ribosomal subunit protein uL5 n=1 Tax=Fimbriimonas ginsengisoli Gsoil 348 TaxID=661478 RepID=A0A068NYN8_FIMGI|nr:50S ribosomal protein L5 [Fimbriimonas ginsengisoli]AIE87149.1 ribosomal protein L5 [Fimbriimonas ginsengisoli Gsoil 348]